MFKQKLSEEIFKKKYCINEGDTSIEAVFKGIAKEISSVEKTDKDKKYWEEQFYKQMIEGKFIPAGRIMANARPDSKQKTYINCFTVGIKDSLDDIYTTLKEMALIAQAGGGSGLNISNIRPENAPLSRGGVASGPLSFMKVINESANVISVAGNRRCLPLNTPIFCKDGIKKIQDIKKGDLVLTSDGYDKVSNTFKQGIQETIILNTQNGIFECTPNHKMPVINGINSYEWKQSKDIKIGDKIVFISEAIDGTHLELPTFKYNKSKHSTTCKDIVIPKLDTDIAWWFGYLFGNGCVRLSDNDCKGTVALAIPYNMHNIVNKAVACFRKFNIEPKLKNGDGCFTLIAHSKQLALYMSQFKQPNTSLFIPDFIKNNTIDIRSAFLAGLFDSDGSSKTRPMQAVCTIYESLRDDVITLYASLGIPTLVKTHIDKKHKNWNTRYKVTIPNSKGVMKFITYIKSYSLKYENIRKCEFIGHSNFDHKYVKDMWVNSNLYKYSKKWTASNTNINVSTIERILDEDFKLLPVDVISISKGRMIETFDIEVKNKHEFVANGFLTHNSATIIILNVDHPDIEKFITCKHGDENKAYQYMNISVGITDKFMKAVEEDREWDLKFEGKIYKTVKAKYLYDLIVTNSFKYAEPGILNLSIINKENNGYYMYSIQECNPCVIGSTPILTDKGNIPIKDLVGKEVNIWNGFEWSKVIPKKTGENQVLMKIEFSSGQELICTPYHKFILDGNTRVEAKDLKIDDKLAKCNYPVIEGTKELTDQEAYLQGFYSGDGFFDNSKNTSQVHFYKPKEMCMKRCGYTPIKITNTKVCRSAHVHNIDKNFVPDATYTIKTRLSWLAGILDSDGCVNGNYCSGFTISSINKQFLLNIQFMLQTLGCNSKVLLEHKAQKRMMPDGHGGQKEYQCQASYRLTLSKYYITHILYDLGLKTERLKQLPKAERNSENLIYIKNLVILDYKEDVYCFTEPKNHSGIFGGVFTGQCGETSMPIYNVCDLGSIKLSTFVDNAFTDKAEFNFKQLKEAIITGIRFLDNVLDCTKLPLEKVKKNVKAERRIGLGFTAYADMLVKLGIKYGSVEAIEFTKKLGEFFRNESYRASIEIAKEKGSFPRLDIEKYIQGNFIKRLPKDIIEDIKQYGIRNINLNCIAPTGTISLSVGNNCSSGIEPIFALSYTRNVKQADGTFKSDDVYDEAFLDYKTNTTSDDIPNYFITVADLSAEQHIYIQSLWQQYIDSSISKTINLPSGTTIDQYKDLFMLAYKSNCKGITFFNPDGALKPILTTKKEDEKQVSTSPCSEIVEHCAPKRPQDILCDIHQIIVDHKPVLVLIGKLKDKIYEVFFDYNFTENGDKKIDVMKAKEGIVRKVKSNHYSLIIKTDEDKELVIIDNIADTFDESAGVIARLISGMLRYGTPLQIVLNQLQKTKNFNSFTKIVARVLKKYIKDGEKVKSGQSICPECGNQLVFESGCIVCKNCGFSKCS